MDNKMVFTSDGIENFCVRLFEKIKEDYFKLMDKINDEATSKRSRADAQRRIAEMEKRFSTGELDAYTDVFPSMDCADIWNGIKQAYAMQKASA